MTLSDLPELEPEEYRRYGRHITLDNVGEAGQRRLKAGSALVVGAGGLGCPVAIYLAAAGVGRITICDFDHVDLSNLQRQVLYGVADLGRPKVQVAAERLRAINPHIDVRTVQDRISSENVRELVRDHDVVVDGTDNFTTRYLVSDACVLEQRPYVYGSIYRFDGQASVFDAREGPCYRCLFPEPPPPGLVPNCAQAGVLGVLPGLVGSIQAAEALKLLIGAGHTLGGRLLLIDALGATFREVRLRKDPGCPACGDSPTIDDAVEGAGVTCLATGPGSGAPSLAAPDLAEEIACAEPPWLLDVREPWEFRSGSLEGAMNIPLGDVLQRLDELPASREIVVFCRMGPRGDRAVEMLTDAGRPGARNLEGGLIAWRDTVDPAAVVA